MDFSKILASARTVLENRTGTTVQFGHVQQLDSQHHVLRVAIEQGAGLPASIIIKQVPENARFGAHQRAMSEWVGLEFSGLIATSVQFSPCFLGGDVDAMLVILEDLGDMPALDIVLHQSDSITARQTLIEYGTFLGQLHRAGKGREGEFQALQKRLAVTAPPNDSSLDLRSMLEKFQATFTPMTDNLDALEQEAIAASAAMHDENSFRTFQHHDAGPHNVLVTADGLRFVDFEFAQYDNALLDMTAVRLAFPPFSQGHILPQEVVLAYENAYREAVCAAIPQIMDEKVYALMLEQTCAKWLLTKIAGTGKIFYPVLVRDERDKLTNPAVAEQLPAYRKMIYTWLTVYLLWFGDNAQLSATRDVLQRILNDMQHHHPEIEANGIYGAFVE